MKASEINVGDLLINDRGKVRQVVGIGPEWKSYPDQATEVCAGYRAVRQNKRGQWVEDRKASGRCTVESMASWAKARVIHPDQDMLDLLAILPIPEATR